MRVQIIHDQDDLLGVGVVLLKEPSHAVGPVDFRPSLSSHDRSPSGQRLEKHELEEHKQIHHPVALVVVVVALQW